MRHADIFVAPGTSPDMETNPVSNRGNEHSHRNSMVAVVDENTCMGCGACMNACPADAIMIDNIARIDIQLCRGCALCIDSCPFRAISMDYTS
jgi:ferredoxin